MTIYYIPQPHKRSQYTTDKLPDAISVASEKSVSNFTTPSDSPQILLLNYDNIKPLHAINKYEPYRVRLKRVY